MKLILLLSITASLAGAQAPGSPAGGADSTRTREPKPAAQQSAKPAAQPAGSAAQPAGSAVQPAKRTAQPAEGTARPAPGAAKAKGGKKAPARPAAKKPSPVPQAAAQEKPAPAAPAQEAPKGKPSSPDAALASLGLLVFDSQPPLEIAGVVPASEAASLKFLPGDRVSRLGSFDLRRREDAAAAVDSVGPKTRLSAVVIRGLSIQQLSSLQPGAAAPAVRSPEELSVHEMLLKEKRMAQAQTAAQEAVGSAPSQELVIARGQTVWVSFPKGIPASAGPGDVVEAEAVTTMCTDENLDFLSVPPKSRLWARILETNGPAQTRNLKLFFFKMKLAGGGYYPVSARAADLHVPPGGKRLVGFTSGGTVVMPPDEAFDPDLKIKAEFLEPVALVEPPGFYRAGPGLWINTRTDGPGFRVSSVIPRRSADSAAIKAGDVIMTIDGVKAEDFASAVSAIYGRAQTDVKLGILRQENLASPKAKIEPVILRRGVKVESGEVVALPPPYGD